MLGQIRRTIGEYPPDTSFRGSPGKGARLRDVRPARIALHPAAAIPAPAAAPDLARTPTAAPLYAGFHATQALILLTARSRLG